MLERLKTLVAEALVGWKKWLILVVLLGVAMAVGYKVYGSYRLRLAHEQDIIAAQFRTQADVAKSEVDRYKKDAELLTAKLAKASDKAAKLQAQIDKIIIPPSPTEVPPTTKQTLAELNNMGLALVLKPSVMVTPSVAGITAQDANRVWFWGKEALRVPGLELKLEKTTDLVSVLNKNVDTANQVIDLRTKEADAALKAADAHRQEADALRKAENDVKSALAAERKKKILYSVGAFGLGYLVTRK